MANLEYYRDSDFRTFRLSDFRTFGLSLTNNSIHRLHDQGKINVELVFCLYHSTQFSWGDKVKIGEIDLPGS